MDDHTTPPPTRLACQKPDKDPLLALRGLGKELWKELGGGEKFIREMRESWSRRDPTA